MKIILVDLNVYRLMFCRYKVEEVPFSVLGSVATAELNDLINKLIQNQVLTN